MDYRKTAKSYLKEFEDTKLYGFEYKKQLKDISDENLNKYIIWATYHKAVQNKTSKKQLLDLIIFMLKNLTVKVVE